MKAHRAKPPAGPAVHLLDGNRPAAEVLHEFESSVPTRRMRL